MSTFKKQNSPFPSRVKWTYTQIVQVPKRFWTFLWDHPDHKALLEKIIYKTLIYGSFKDIQWIYKKYPEECFTIINNYTDIERGVKFWIKYWHENSLH